MKSLFLLAFNSINVFDTKTLHLFSKNFYSNNRANSLANDSRLEIGIAAANVTIALVGDAAAHARDLDVHDVVPVQDQFLDTHRHRFREQSIRGTRLLGPP